MRRGQRASGLVAGATGVVAAWTRGELLLLPEGYPALVDGPGRVEGELCRFDDLDVRTLAALDDYEGFLPGDPARSLYLREVRAIFAEGDRSVRAWTYVAPPGRRAALVARGARPLPRGVWPPEAGDVGAVPR